MTLPSYPRAAALAVALLLPGALSAQSRHALTTYVAADAAFPAAPVLLGASLATGSGGLGARLGVATDAWAGEPGRASTWSAEADGTVAPGALVPALRRWHLFAGVGARRVGTEEGAEPVVLSTSLGAGYRLPLAGPLAVEGELRYRVPLPERLPPGVELRLGLSLGTRLPAPPPAASVPASRPVVFIPGADADAPAPAVARLAIATGEEFLGVPYRWGGNTPEEGFDCSGFLRYVYLRQGIALPRVSRDQARAGEPLPLDISALRPGDLMFFATEGAEVDHAAMYVGGGRILHSSASGRGVRYDDLSGRRGEYFLRHFVAARRVIPDQASLSAPAGR